MESSFLLLVLRFSRLLQGLSLILPFLVVLQCLRGLVLALWTCSTAAGMMVDVGKDSHSPLRSRCPQSHHFPTHCILCSPCQHHASSHLRFLHLHCRPGSRCHLQFQICPSMNYFDRLAYSQQ